MSERIDFSANASVGGAEVLDVGAGTGRMSIPLARHGCRVVAIEPARAMLDRLRAKAGDEPLLTVVAEGARLPFAAARFDVVVIARLLYLAARRSRLCSRGKRRHRWWPGDYAARISPAAR